MNSDGHRRNILNCGYRNIGVGLVYDAGKTPLGTQDFAGPRQRRTGDPERAFCRR